MTDTPDAPFLLHMNDALAASALVAAVLAAFFTLWQGEIQDALNRPASEDTANWETTAAPIRRVLWGRVVPLCLISIATLTVLSVRAWGIAANALACDRTCPYDDVQALFLLTELLILGLSGLTLFQLGRLLRRLLTRS